MTGCLRRRWSSLSGARWRETSSPGCGGRLDGPVRCFLCCYDFKVFAMLLVHESTAYHGLCEVWLPLYVALNHSTEH